MNQQIWLDLSKIYTEIALALSVLCIVIVDLSFPVIRRKLTFAIAGTGLIGAFLLALPLFKLPAGAAFFGVVAVDPQAAFFKCFLLATSFLVLLLVPKSRELATQPPGEFCTLLLSVTLGMLLLASSLDMVMLFLSMEMVSIGSYIMVGYLKHDRASNEASLKYLLFGTVASGCMLYGMTLVYGLTGTTKILIIRDTLLVGSSSGTNTLLIFLATVFIFSGFGFKTASVPFHFWCPDVYTGAPTPVTAFLSVAPKAAGFAALIRFFFTGFAKPTGSNLWDLPNDLHWHYLILIASIATMVLGNIAALRQENMKRMLAYSSIAHAGYVLMGVAVVTEIGLQAVLIYLITYLFMNLGAFLIVIEVFNQTGSFEMKDYRGLYRRAPFLSIAMSFFMLSLMGIPPLAGFWGKLYVFAAAVKQNLAWFAVVGALNSVISVYYYARVIKCMVIDTGENATSLRIPVSSYIYVWVLLLPIVGIMLIWDVIERLAAFSTRLFGG